MWEWARKSNLWYCFGWALDLTLGQSLLLRLKDWHRCKRFQPWTRRPRLVGWEESKWEDCHLDIKGFTFSELKCLQSFGKSLGVVLNKLEIPTQVLGLESNCVLVLVCQELSVEGGEPVESWDCQSHHLLYYNIYNKWISFNWLIDLKSL